MQNSSTEINFHGRASLLALHAQKRKTNKQKEAKQKQKNKTDRQCIDSLYQQRHP